MAKEFSKAFYNSRAWKDCRESYIKNMPVYKRGLCEHCYREGKYTLGKELHHIEPLTPNNINNRRVTLGHDNLVLLCFECHQKEHDKRNGVRYKFDEHGNIIPV